MTVISGRIKKKKKKKKKKNNNNNNNNKGVNNNNNNNKTITTTTTTTAIKPHPKSVQFSLVSYRKWKRAKPPTQASDTRTTTALLIMATLTASEWPNEMRGWL